MKGKGREEGGLSELIVGVDWYRLYGTAITGIGLCAVLYRTILQ